MVIIYCNKKIDNIMTSGTFFFDRSKALFVSRVRISILVYSHLANVLWHGLKFFRTRHL